MKISESNKKILIMVVFLSILIPKSVLEAIDRKQVAKWKEKEEQRREKEEQWDIERHQLEMKLHRIRMKLHQIRMEKFRQQSKPKKK